MSESIDNARLIEALRRGAHVRHLYEERARREALARAGAWLLAIALVVLAAMVAIGPWASGGCGNLADW